MEHGDHLPDANPAGVSSKVDSLGRPESGWIRGPPLYAYSVEVDGDLTIYESSMRLSGTSDVRRAHRPSKGTTRTDGWCLLRGRHLQHAFGINFPGAPHRGTDGGLRFRTASIKEAQIVTFLDHRRGCRQSTGAGYAGPVQTRTVSPNALHPRSRVGDRLLSRSRRMLPRPRRMNAARVTQALIHRSSSPCRFRPSAGDDGGTQI